MARLDRDYPLNCFRFKMVDLDEILRRIQREENVVDTIFSYQRTVHSAVANSNMEAVSTLPLYGANSDVSFIFSACQYANRWNFSGSWWFQWQWVSWRGDERSKDWATWNVSSQVWSLCLCESMRFLWFWWQVQTKWENITLGHTLESVRFLCDGFGVSGSMQTMRNIKWWKI